MSKPAKSSFAQYVVYGLLYSSGHQTIYVCYPVFPRDAQYAPLPSVMHSVQFFVNVAVNGNSSAPYRRVDRIIVSYNFVFTFKLISSFFQIFLIFAEYCCCFFTSHFGIFLTAAIERYVADNI